MIDFSVTLTRQAERLIQNDPAADIALAHKRAMENVRARLERQHKAKHMHTAFGGRSPKTSLGVRSEKLRNSYMGTIRVNRGAASANMHYGSNLHYAKINEAGGMIWPRNAKWLTIPLRRGLPRARTLLNQNNHFFKKAKSGRIFIWRRDGNTIRPLYLLARSVKIPARPTARLAHEETERENVRTIMREVAEVFGARRF